MSACESKLASRSSRKATVGQVLRVLGWALTRIRNLSLVQQCDSQGSCSITVRWLCVEKSRELFSNIRGRGEASNACFHS